MAKKPSFFSKYTKTSAINATLIFHADIDLIANARTGIGKSLLCLFGAAAGAYFGFFVGRSKDDEQM